jgi:hypothetical protein
MLDPGVGDVITGTAEKTSDSANGATRTTQVLLGPLAGCSVTVHSPNNAVLRSAKLEYAVVSIAERTVPFGCVNVAEDAGTVENW